MVRSKLAALAAALAAAALAAPGGGGLLPEARAQAQAESGLGPSRVPDVIYVPTPQPVVDAMLDLAKVKPGDVVYDLGCGDGRIVIGAAKRGAARAVGVDIDPERLREARANAVEAGVQDQVTFVEGDLFEMDFSDADVVTLYLLPELNLRLRPKLLALAPGTRIVSHAFDMGDWKPETTLHVDGRTVFAWTVPPNGKRARAQAPVGR